MSEGFAPRALAYSSLFMKSGFPDLGRWVRETGFHHLEAADNLFARGESADAIRTSLHEAGLTVSSYHLPLAREDDLASLDEEERQATVERMKVSLRRAITLGAKSAVAHPSTNRSACERVGYTKMLGALARSMETLLPIAAAGDLRICLENMLVAEDGPRLGARPEHFVEFRRRFAGAGFGCCLDTGHAFVSMRDQAGDFVEAMGEDLVAWHLNDNAGDRDSHLAPGHGRIDWRFFGQAAARLPEPFVICVETPPFAFGPDYTMSAYRELRDSTLATVFPAGD